ncbi:MAG: SRPBCC domain-containing protein [Sphingomonas sp.]|uniref:SRPBCC family protein n=1 Tax=Sphingomonas sp. TaxID=28214 RepID=UPI0017D9237C|nr:SRPBCC domain-containing protein [Sphingomonas sp.]MBA3666643.1 SRPBCC domain-containing protein [Sphingomonas sp.]
MHFRSNGAEKPDYLTIERILKAPVDQVWDLWTTKQGIEAWWGPQGFRVTVTSMDLKAGGALRYTMTADTDETRAFMLQSGMPLETETRLVFTLVNPPHQLEYTDIVDFVPGVATYELQTQVQLIEVAQGTRLILSFHRMHDQIWTERKRAGWESELNKLSALLAEAA